MSTTTKLTFEQFQQMPQREATIYELDEGQLLITPSPTPWHNIVRYRLRRALTDFVQTHSLGMVLDKTDFRLARETARKPDLAYLNRERLKNFDPDHSPIECAPTLAVEVISPSNLAQDTLKKVRQYLASGSEAVWLIYPVLRLVEIHDSAGVREVVEPQALKESQPFAGVEFSISLSALFDKNLER